MFKPVLIYINLVITSAGVFLLLINYNYLFFIRIEGRPMHRKKMARCIKHLSKSTRATSSLGGVALRRWRAEAGGLIVSTVFRVQQPHNTTRTAHAPAKERRLGTKQTHVHIPKWAPMSFFWVGDLIQIRKFLTNLLMGCFTYMFWNALEL